ncbi:MAG: hypothetical protein KDD34_02160 [Bdellovibrionales bacterium]|nr:hypothetical protein [Bdellovibrionales bacterium]
MREPKLRITYLLLLFMAVFALRGWAEEETPSSSPEVSSATEVKLNEMERALQLANEIQALNRGDFDVANEKFHPDFQVLLNEKNLSLSVNSN